MRHLEGHTRRPLQLVYHEDNSATFKGLSKPLTNSEVEEHEDKLNDYLQKEAIVKNQIYSTISDQMLIRVQSLKTAGDIWAEIVKTYEIKSVMHIVDTQ